MTTFVDNSTVIQAIWLNGVDRAVTQAIGDGYNPPTTTAEVQDNLGINLKADTSYVDSQDALKSDITTTVTKDSSTGAGHLPVGTTAQRPWAPADGYVRYNTTTLSYEGYKNGNWLPLGGGATGGGTNDVFYENSSMVTSDYTITTNKNAMSAGPITVNNGVTVTVPNGSVWSII